MGRSASSILIRCRFDPARGIEANTRRPAVVISNGRANAVAERLGRGVVTAIPLTSNTTRVFPFRVLVPADQGGLRIDSNAQAEQVRSVAVERLGAILGQIPASTMIEIDQALRLYLDL